MIAEQYLLTHGAPSEPASTSAAENVSEAPCCSTSPKSAEPSGQRSPLYVTDFPYARRSFGWTSCAADGCGISRLPPSSAVSRVVIFLRECRSQACPAL